MLHIAPHRIFIGQPVEPHHLIRLTVEVVVVDSLAVVSVSQESVASRCVGLTERKPYRAVHVVDRRVGRIRLAEPPTLSNVTLIVRHAVLRFAHAFLNLLQGVGRLCSEQLVQLVQPVDTLRVGLLIYCVSTRSHQSHQEQQHSPYIFLAIPFHFLPLSIKQ